LRILLLNVGDFGSSGKGYSVPLGLAYLAAVASERGHHVCAIDLASSLNKTINHYLQCVPETMKAIQDANPDLVGITCTTPNRYNVIFWADLIRRHCPGCFIVLGGPHASYNWQEILQRFDCIDAIVIGEGEQTFAELCQALHDGRDFADIAGLAYRRGDGQALANPPRPFATDLDSIPLPRRDLFPMDEYDLCFGGIDRGKSIPVMTSRGCPGACKFCSTSHYWGKRLRSRSPDNIAAEVEHLATKYPAAEWLVFFDDTLTINSHHLAAMCEVMSGYRFRWTCRSRIDAQLDARILNRMYDAGCRSVAFGVESGSPRMLAELHKNYDRQRAVKILRLCRRTGIRPTMTLIVGMPGETKADSLETVHLIRQAGLLPCDVGIAPFTALFPGTPWFEQFHQKHPAFSWFGHDGDGTYSTVRDKGGRLIYPCHEHPPDLRRYLNRLVQHAYRHVALRRYPLYYLRWYLLPKLGLQNLMLPGISWQR